MSHGDDTLYISVHLGKKGASWPHLRINILGGGTNPSLSRPAMNEITEKIWIFVHGWQTIYEKDKYKISKPSQLKLYKDGYTWTVDITAVKLQL